MYIIYWTASAILEEICLPPLKFDNNTSLTPNISENCVCQIYTHGVTRHRGSVMGLTIHSSSGIVHNSFSRAHSASCLYYNTGTSVFVSIIHMHSIHWVSSLTAFIFLSSFPHAQFPCSVLTPVVIRTHHYNIFTFSSSQLLPHFCRNRFTSRPYGNLHRAIFLQILIRYMLIYISCHLYAKIRHSSQIVISGTVLFIWAISVIFRQSFHYAIIR